MAPAALSMDRWRSIFSAAPKEGTIPSLVHKATPESAAVDEDGDLPTVLEVCDRANLRLEDAHAIATALRARAAHKSPDVRRRCCLLIEALIKNCGQTMHRELATCEDMHHHLVSCAVAQNDPCGPQARKLLASLAHFADGRPELAALADLRRRAESSGADFTDVPVDDWRGVAGPGSHGIKDDERLYQEHSPRAPAGRNRRRDPTDERRVRFAAESGGGADGSQPDGVAALLEEVLDAAERDGDADADTVRQIAAEARRAQNSVVRKIPRANEASMFTLLALNDRLLTALDRADILLSGEAMVLDTDEPPAPADPQPAAAEPQPQPAPAAPAEAAAADTMESQEDAVERPMRTEWGVAAVAAAREKWHSARIRKRQQEDGAAPEPAAEEPAAEPAAEEAAAAPEPAAEAVPLWQRVLTESFGRFDADGDGRLSREEFRAFVRFFAEGETFGDEQCDLLLAKQAQKRGFDPDQGPAVQHLSKLFRSKQDADLQRCAALLGIEA
eukprot:TRINITY_DN251_c0_g1_i1.p1 TRINITY_DN251_c0_g1~~TRINITY_DN251_c0_g1_i1.p1  ORF type:complete len:521 (+),score=230.89 TRINITY_DN251_c0_g1_i1:55-1563(+)